MPTCLICPTPDAPDWRHRVGTHRACLARQRRYKGMSNIGQSKAEKSWHANTVKRHRKKVGRAMHERKRGTLKSGRSGNKVKSRKQAIAIGLSEARRAGKKVPKKKTAARR